MNLSRIFLYLLVFFINVPFGIGTIPFNPTNNCVLDLHNSSLNTDSNCNLSTWDGFINTCCGTIFNQYLQALAWRTNQTGQIFLDSTEQFHCLSYMKSIHTNFSTCGIEKLTKNAEKCSNYSANDVINKLGNRLRILNDDCQQLGSASDSVDQDCNQCLRTWENINDSKNFESSICRFVILIMLTSQRVLDDKWFKATSKCLGDNTFVHQDKTFQAYKVNKNTLSPTSSPSNQEEVKEAHGLRSKEGFYAMVAGLGVLALIITAICCFFCRRRAKKLQKPEIEIYKSFYDDSTFETISLREVYSATDNLSPINIIGQGIAGKVYKGVLSNGQHIAVKHIINDGQMESFVREVKSLSHIKHQNLVSLLGHCDGEDECFLVYELCHNGNLSQWLFGKDKNLSWIKRLEIAIDCARGLWFLHTYPEGCIVHRDIKPTNILLCNDFQGKLSDFGLSKVMNMGQSFVSSEVRGTFGYVDPEYQKNRHVNSSGDVYSFGIVLLQILSGQRVINMDMHRPMHVNKMAKSYTKDGNIIDFADPKLNRDYSIEAFKLVLKQALSCTGLKQQRPSMGQVVTTLEKALEISATFKSIRPSSIYTRH